ncbi:MAG: flagellar motor protein MotB [Burkholderiaceae bacterium]
MLPNKSGGHHETVVKRVSRKHEEDAHGGAWKVAFADFCLALLCLFLVLWLLASRNSERLQIVLQSAGANLVEDGNGLVNSLASGSRGSMLDRNPVPAFGEIQAQGKARQSNTSAEADNAGEQNRQRYDSPVELAALARMIERVSAEEGLAGNLQTAVTPQGLRLMLHDTDARGMFERGSAVPSERFKALLRKLGPVFAQMQNQLLIVGHTDASQYSDRGPAAFSNWALSAHRAMAARFHLLEGGMPEHSVLQVAGMADSALLDPAHPQAAPNRRIELMVLTSKQSAVMANMFGAPRESLALGEGLHAETPQAAQELRKVLAPAQQAAQQPLQQPAQPAAQ